MKILYAIPFLIAFTSCSTQKEEYLLNEEFSQNSIGWVEETTDSHQTELVDGKLIIKSMDTTAAYSSNGPRNRSAIWSLPKNWQFTSSMEVMDGGPEAGFGFLLYSS